MELRSHSYQHKKYNKGKNQLRLKLDYILNDKCAPNPANYLQQDISKRKKSYKFDHANLHPAILRVESIENIEFANMKSAIHQLQEFITPTSNTQNVHNWNQVQQGNFIKAEIHPNNVQKQQTLQTNHESDVLRQQKQIMEYYKLQNNRLKLELSKQREENKRLYNKLEQVKKSYLQAQKDIRKNINVNKGQQKNRIVELKKDFKHQLVINLQLQQLLLKQHIKHLQTKKHYEDKHDKKDHLQQVIKHLVKDNQRLKQQNESLKAIEQQHKLQIKQLRQQINCENGQSYQQLQSPTFPPLKGTHQNIIISTNASLQNTRVIQRIAE